MSFSGVTLSQFPEYLQAMLQVKRACASTNVQTGFLAEDKGKRIIQACQQLAAQNYVGQFPVDVFHGGGGIGLNMNVNEVIASLAGEGLDPVEDVNLSQSTADVCHTALRLALLHQLSQLDPVLSETISILREKGREFSGVLTIARTCWQDGMRVEASALFDATAHALERQKEKLLRIRQDLYRVNLGGTVIGSGIGAPLPYRQLVIPELARVTSLPLLPCEDLFDAAQYPDDIAELSSLLRQAAEVTAKLSRDLRLLSSGPETGLGELKLPAVQAGSSFFPGKVNPVVPEMMIQCAMLVAGNDTVIQAALGQGEIHLNLWEEMSGFLLMQNLSRYTQALEKLNEKCLRGVMLDRRQCEEYANGSIPLIVDYKEQFGYGSLSRRIKEDGLAQVIAQLKDETRNQSERRQ